MIENQNVALNQFVGDNHSMTKNLSSVLTVKPDDSIHDALVQMQTNFIKRVVVTLKNKPVGIVSERDINKFLEKDKTARALYEIPIKHVMNKNLITIMDESMDDRLNQCAMRMETFKIGSVILVDSAGDLTGIVTTTDITKAFSVVYGGKYLVKDYMSSNVVTCRKSDSVRFALNMINRNKISRLVVTDDNGNPCGLITTNTFLTHSNYFTKPNSKTRDYLLPDKSSNNIHVGELVNEKLLTIGMDEDLSTASSRMVKNKISGIPVVDNEKNLVGIITKSDIVRAFSVVGSHEELRAKYASLY